MMKTIFFTFLISVLFTFSSCSGCQGAKTFSDPAQTPESSAPAEDETENATEEDAEEDTGETPETDGSDSDIFVPETSPDESTPETPNEPPSNEPTQTPEEPSTDEAPAGSTQENPLPVTQDTIFTPPSASLVYLYEASTAGTLLIETEKAEMLTVKKVTESGLETVEANGELSVQKGERFYIFVTNSGTVPLEWIIVLEP
ncbi:MAG: hypothetical protein IJ506_05130 [Clostridia bacterium]|nr:hypothetical protein [Clostridia bacterium]